MELDKYTDEEIEIEGIKFYGVPTSDDITATVYFKLTIEGDVDSEKMPGKPYDENTDYSPKYNINNEEKEKWLEENIKNPWFFNMSMFYFTDREDAVAYKLRWC